MGQTQTCTPGTASHTPKPRRPQSSIRYASAVRCLAASINPPAVRLVVLNVWRDDNDNGKVHVDTFPVVGLLARIYRVFHKSYLPETDCGRQSLNHGTEKELAERGFVLDEQDVRTDVVIVFEGRLTALDDVTQGIVSTDEVFRVVACPWLAEQDDERLKPEIAALTASLSRPKPKPKPTTVPTRPGA